MEFKRKIILQIFVVSCVILINRAEETDLKPKNISHEETATTSSLTNSTTVSITATHSRWFPKIFVRLHGCVLVIAWLGLTPVSILIARYYKNDINCEKYGFGQLWFQIHRVLMYSSLVLNILGAIFIYMRIGGWSGVSSQSLFFFIIIFNFLKKKVWFT
jgi:hypothetical protein